MTDKDQTQKPFWENIVEKKKRHPKPSKKDSSGGERGDRPGRDAPYQGRASSGGDRDSSYSRERDPDCATIRAPSRDRPDSRGGERGDRPGRDASYQGRAWSGGDRDSSYSRDRSDSRDSAAPRGSGYSANDPTRATSRASRDRPDSRGGERGDRPGRDALSGTRSSGGDRDSSYSRDRSDSRDSAAPRVGLFPRTIRLARLRAPFSCDPPDFRGGERGDRPGRDAPYQDALRPAATGIQAIPRAFRPAILRAPRGSGLFPRKIRLRDSAAPRGSLFPRATDSRTPRPWQRGTAEVVKKISGRAARPGFASSSWKSRSFDARKGRPVRRSAAGNESLLESFRARPVGNPSGQ